MHLSPQKFAARFVFTRSIGFDVVLGFLLALLAVSPAVAASHTWSGAVNGLFSNPGNWSAGGVPAMGEANLSLVFPASATRTVMTNDIGALTVNSMNFQGSNYVLRGASTITFGSSLINVLCNGTSNVIESTLNLPSGFFVSVGDNDVMAFHTLTGAGFLAKLGAGEVQLRGGANNTLSGGYTVNVGTLRLQKTGGATAVASELTIVGTTNVGDYASVWLDGSDQIAGNVNVTIHPSGILSLNNKTNTINDLTVMSGTVWLGGLLRLNGDLTLSATDNPFPTPDVAPLIDVDLEFIGTTSFIIVSNLTCGIDGNIVEYGGATAINKTGPGALALQGTANNYTGALNINQGRVIAEHSTALGTIAGNTVVASGATLELRGGINSSEAISLTGLGVDGLGALQALAGAHTLSGSITLTGETGIGVNGSGNSLILSGAVGGAGGIRKLGDGTLTLSGFGNNSFSGASWVAAGRLNLGKSAGVRAIGSVTVTNGAQLHFNNNEQMDNVGVLSIYQGGTVNLTNRTETLGGLNLSPRFTLDLGAGLLALNGDVYVGSPYYTNAPFYSTATIRGQVSLGGATRLIDTPGFALALDGNVIDGPGVGGFILGQPGALYYTGLQLLRSNSFSGPVFLHGSLSVSNDFALGAPGGGVFADASQAEIRFLGANNVISGETLTLSNSLSLVASGNNAWNGPIQIPAVASLVAKVDLGRILTLGGTISGLGGVGIGSESAPGGTLRLMTANSYSGTTDIGEGTVVIRHPQALGSPAGYTALYFGPATLRLELPDGAIVGGEPLIVSDSFGLATLIVAGSGSNSWTGPVTNNTISRLRVNQPDGGTFTFNTRIVGSGGIEKNDSGSLYFSGADANGYTGDTVVNDGTLFLNKPNGVQAVGNLTIYAPGDVRWLASEQVADAATLRVRSALLGGFSPRTNVFLFNQQETLTHLNTRRGVIVADNGSLGLLGDVDISNDEQGNGYGGGLLWAKVRLGPGPHLIFNTNPNPDPNGFTASLHLFDSISETGGSASITTSNCVTHLYASNSFTGPMVVNMKGLNIYHPNALGSPAQGTLLTNSAGLLLNMPNGSVVADESLQLSPPALGSPFFSGIGLFEHTNTWAGPITLLGENRIYDFNGSCKLILSGPIDGPAALTVECTGEVELTGPHTNTASGFNVYRGTVRLNKTPGAYAFTGLALLDGTELDSIHPKVILEAPGQFPPTTEVAVGQSSAPALFDLNGHAATIAGLGGMGGAGTVKIGNGTLTIAPTAASYGFNGVVLANAGGPRLLKQGTGSQALFASFGNNTIAGELLVQTGDLSLGNGTYGPVTIAAGANVQMYASSASFDSLSGAGTLETTYNGTTRVGENNASTEFSGTIQGNTPNSIVKTGTGTLALTGTNTHTGTLRVENGTLLVNGSVAGTVRVQPAAPGQTPNLGGTGSLGNVVVTSAGASIAPGNPASVPSYGRLTVTNIAVDSGALYLCEIGGTNAGVNLDQIEARDTFTLTGGLAEFTAFGAGVTSNRYAVVKSVSAVSGTFNGDPEGDTIMPAAGRSMVISYLTAAGKEITLIEQPGANLANLSISNIVQQVNGHITLTGTGNSGSTYLIEANTNLTTTNWITLGSVIGNGNGDMSFTDTNAPNFPQRFYRFRLE